MHDVPQDWLALIVLVFVLGMKHGFDADHLAVIDGLTRYNSQRGRGFARYCGALFSLGHGLVVVLVALLAAALAGGANRAGWQVPGWLEDFGAWVSIAFLLALGALNLRAVWLAAPGQVVQPLGLKGRLLGSWQVRLQQAGSPLLVGLVGSLFAFSFDTLSQAAFFALAGNQLGGWQVACGLGLLFMLGMLVTDGINGWWVSRLLARADRVAQVASRVMGGAVAVVSLATAAFGIWRRLAPALPGWLEEADWLFSAGLLVLLALAFVLALRLARRPLLTEAPARAM